jgi:rhodanese-related sulfurtransferase
MVESLELTPQELKRRLDGGEKIFLIDCREPAEYQQARIDGAVLIPMRAIPASLQEIECKADEAEVIVVCHHGVRSLQVANWLREQGLSNAHSLAGGIERWSCEIDASVPRY